jgi:hypothetical protein
LKQSSVELTDFTAAFLVNYPGSTATAKLHKVKQQFTEDVNEFYAIVINIIDKWELILPAAARRLAVVAMPVQPNIFRFFLQSLLIAFYLTLNCRMD